MGALALLASCGGSNPVIVSGKIAMNGDNVDVEIFGLEGVRRDDLSQPIAFARELQGQFELRGVMDASDARGLLLDVTPQGYAAFSCGAQIALPPLRRSQDRWVDARTGEPVVLHIALRLQENSSPGTTYADWCPLESRSALSTVSSERAEEWADKWCRVQLGMNLEEADEIMGEPTLTFQGQHLWDAYQWHFTALAKSDWTIRQLDSTEEGSTPEGSKVHCGDPVLGVSDTKTRQ
jgi:hypothetical protein